MPGALIGVGSVLVVCTLLLAFTIFGEISGALGVICLVCGGVMLARQSPKGVDPGGKRRPHKP